MKKCRQLSTKEPWSPRKSRYGTRHSLIPLAVAITPDRRTLTLFAGSLRSGQRAAAIMSLIQSARMNGHDPYAYLRDVMTRLPTTKQADIATLLPHHWQPAAPTTACT